MLRITQRFLRRFAGMLSVRQHQVKGAGRPVRAVFFGASRRSCHPTRANSNSRTKSAPCCCCAPIRRRNGHSRCYRTPRWSFPQPYPPLLKPETDNRQFGQAQKQFPDPLIILGRVLDDTHERGSGFHPGNGTSHHRVTNTAAYCGISNKGIQFTALKLGYGRF